MLIPLVVFLLVIVLIQEHRLKEAQKDAAEWRLAAEWLQKLMGGPMDPETQGRGCISPTHAGIGQLAGHAPPVPSAYNLAMPFISFPVLLAILIFGMVLVSWVVRKVFF